MKTRGGGGGSSRRRWCTGRGGSESRKMGSSGRVEARGGVSLLRRGSTGRLDGDPRRRLWLGEREALGVGVIVAEGRGVVL